MRTTTIIAALAASSLSATAVEVQTSLSASVSAIPQCSLSAFKSALDKQGCDTNTAAAATFDCLCKSVTDISASMALSVSDADCLTNWAAAIASVCAYWTTVSTSASDYAQATKALGSELGASATATATTSSSVNGTVTKASPTTTSAAATSSPSKAPGVINTPVPLFIGVAALAGLLV